MLWSQQMLVNDRFRVGIMQEGSSVFCEADTQSKHNIY